MLTRPSQIKITLLWHEVAKSEISGFHLGFQQPQKIKTKRKKDQKGCALSRRQDSKEQLCLRLPPIFHDGFDETAKHWFPHVFLRVILVSWMCWIFGRKTITKTYTSYIQSGSRRNQQSRPQTLQIDQANQHLPDISRNRFHSLAQAQMVTSKFQGNHCTVQMIDSD